MPPGPKPAAGCPLRGQQVAILGQRRDGSIALRAAASGGRVVSAAGSTPTVIGEEPFGYIRHDAQFLKALDRQCAGEELAIVSERELERRLA